MTARDAATELRRVESRDPSLSPEANRILTDELRQVIGRDEVEVPVGRPHHETEAHGRHSGLLVTFDDNRILLGTTFVGAIVVGAVISLITGSWWFLALAVAIDVVGTIVIASIIIGLTRDVEHLPPSAVARLQDEGVEDPDRLFTDLVAEYAPPTPADRRVREERTVAPEVEPPRASAEQRIAQTPTDRPSRPVGPS